MPEIEPSQNRVTLEEVQKFNERFERMNQARGVVEDLSQTMIENGIEAPDVAFVLEEVAKSLKSYR